jgi:hypothetical protein
MRFLEKALFRFKRLDIQPTKKLTKVGVRRRCETSFLVRFNHSCVLNALLEMVNDALN